MNPVLQNIVSYFLIALLFAFYYFFGNAILQLLGKKTAKRLSSLEMLFISIFIGLFFQTWISFLIALLMKSIITGHLVSIILGVCFIVIYRRPAIKNEKLVKEIINHKISIIIFLVITFILLFTVFFRFEGENIYASPPNFGDWALHVSLINNFAHGNNIPSEYTFYSGAKLGYPFLNFYANAIFVNLGMNIFHAFNLFQCILTFSLLVMAYLLGNRLFGKKAYALLFSVILFFGGGLGWIYLFEDNKPFLSAIGDRDYYIIHDKNVLPLDLSIHSYSQRTGLLGWIYIFIILILLFEEVFNKQEWGKLNEYFLAMLLIGGSFFFHSYGFLLLMIFLLCILIQKPAKQLFTIIFVSGLLGLPQVLWTADQTMKKGFIKFIGGLFIPFTKPIAFLWMWCKNFGLILIFAAIGFIKGKHTQLLLPFLAFFIIGNTVLLQPWDFDNHKWMIGCYFILAILGIGGIKEVWDQKIRWKIILCRTLVVLAVLLILFPSMIGTYYYHKQKYPFSNSEDIMIGEKIMELVPENSVILTATQHNHPVFLYSSRPIFEGFRGWIWTHGLNLSRDRETKAMFESKDKKEACILFKKNNIAYVYISDWERGEDWYKVNESFFKENFKIVYNESNRFLFEVDC